ncbi:MAG: spermidine/putrescine ABC transporter substrate-binding protein, partial [Spirochaetes bacterium GWB1_36_13]
MKKLFIFLMLLSLFAGCSKEKKGDTLFVYNWSYYIPQEVIDGFVNEYKVKVIYDVFSSNEEMYAKLQAGATGYDITFPTNDYVSVMKKAGLLEKLDKSKLSNLKYLDKSLTDLITYDPGMEYSIPYVLGATGIAVNKKKVKNYSKDFSLFERSDLKGKMALLDDMREVLGSALMTLGYSPNSVKAEELKQAKALVMKWKKNILKFDAESFGKGYANGEYWVVHGYAENVFEELDDEMKNNTDFFLPEKGCQMYIDSMVILKSSQNKELAYDFINYIHRPEVYAKVMDFVKSPSINEEARKILKFQPRYKTEDLKRCIFKDDL